MLLLQLFFPPDCVLSILCFSPPAALAMGLCVAMIAFVRLPSLKVSCLLLSGLLIYDVFWVRKAPIQEFTSITATAMRCSRLCAPRHTHLKDIHKCTLYHTAWKAMIQPLHMFSKRRQANTSLIDYFILLAKETGQLALMQRSEVVLTECFLSLTEFYSIMIKKICIFGFLRD